MSDISNLTGQDSFKRAPQYKVDEIHVQGDVSKHKFYKIDAGHFKMKHTSEEADKEKGYNITDLGTSLPVVFLKIRRVLSEYKKAPQTSLRTNEHNTSSDLVTLYGADGGAKVGLASDLRQAYQGLRTQQVVYVFVPSLKKVCKLIVKGSSLGSEAKADGVMGFYDYLSSFNKNNERVHEHFTNLKAIAEGDYFTISFEKGAKLSDEQITKIETLVKEVHAEVSAVDEYYKEKHSTFAKKGEVKDLPTIQTEEADVPDAIEYPEEDIDPESIPF
jgi:hypothetical protein